MHENHQFYGVFDGHNGNLASKYVSSPLYCHLASQLGDVDDYITDDNDNDYNDDDYWKFKVSSDIVESFHEYMRGYSMQSNPTPE